MEQEFLIEEKKGKNNMREYTQLSLFEANEPRPFKAKRRRGGSQNPIVFNDYDSFIAKFTETPKTTDECWTPRDVYEAVVQYVGEIYDLTGKQILRPFYPGGDYANAEYPEDGVVVDNPPFSIFSKICRFYAAANIPFFLFGPGLTISQVCDVCTAVVVPENLTFTNGAKVSCNFATNLMGDILITTSARLGELLRRCPSQATEKRNLPAYVYPGQLASVSDFQTIAKGGVDFALMRKDAAKAFLFYVIFGNLNVQATYNADKDSNGLYQGGLGTGATNAGSWWGNSFENYPVIPMSAGIEYGDAVGNFSYNVLDGNGDLLQTMSCHNFFGLKNGMGGIMWRMMTDELLVNQEDKSQKHYIAEHLWKVNGNYEYSIAESLTGFIEGGTLPAKDYAGWDYITRVSVNLLQLTPTAVGGSSTTRFADGYYNPAGTSGFRLVLRSGSLNHGDLCGLALVRGDLGVSYAAAYSGSSLCESAEEWSVTPEYVEVN